MERKKCMPKAENVKLSEDGRRVIIIDQTGLPGELNYLTLEKAEDMYDAILKLKVRGAPAIGIFAAYSMYCLALQIEEKEMEGFLEKLSLYKEYLDSSRPTAVNLNWALKRMENVAKAHAAEGKEKVLEIMENEARAIQQEDIDMCLAISRYGLSLVNDGDGILTHCNAGPLATSCYGTALGPILLGTEKGMRFHVFADETRPLLQGARLTAYELHQAGVDVTLICDNMAGTVMKNGWIQACFVGCDRIAANGDTANKIGTNQVAILASYYNIPFYVLGPSSTIDMNCNGGKDIHIELRDQEEIKNKFYKKPMAPEGVRCYNPAFDVTDHTLISAIITEKGIIRAPYNENLKNLFGKDNGGRI